MTEVVNMTEHELNAANDLLADLMPIGEQLKDLGGEGLSQGQGLAETLAAVRNLIASAEQVVGAISTLMGVPDVGHAGRIAA